MGLGRGLVKVRGSEERPIPGRGLMKKGHISQMGASGPEAGCKFRSVIYFMLSYSARARNIRQGLIIFLASNIINTVVI